LHQVATDLLDALGLLLLAAGATAAAWQRLGPAALAVGGVVVLGGSWLADRLARPPAAGDEE